MSLEGPPLIPSFFLFVCCGPICSSDRRVFGAWSRWPDPCLSQGLTLIEMEIGDLVSFVHEISG